MLLITFLIVNLAGAISVQSLPPIRVSVPPSQPPTSVPSSTPLADASGNLTGNVKNFRGCSSRQKYDLRTAFRDATEIAKAALPVDVNDYVIILSFTIDYKGADLELISSIKISLVRPNTLHNMSTGFKTT